MLTTETVRGRVVTAVNGAGRRAGVQPEMTLADARAVCPGLVSELHDTERDRQVLQDLAFWLGRYGPRRNYDGSDGLWVETTGVDHLFGGEADMLADLIMRCARAGLTARAGLAETHGAAFALARFACHRKQPFSIIAQGDLQKALAEIPVDGLRLAEDSVRLLKRLGLRRIGQLTAVSRIALNRRFREDGRGVRRATRDALARAVVWRLDQAFGLELEPRRAIEPEPVRMCRLAFADPLISADGVESAAHKLVTQLCKQLETQGEGALAACLILYRSDHTRAVIEVTASQPSHAPDHWKSLLRERLATIDAGLGIDAVTFAAMKVGPVRNTQSALVRSGCEAVSSQVEMVALVDRLSNRLGADRVRRNHAIESHIPERADAWQSARDCEQPRSQAVSPNTVRARKTQATASAKHAMRADTKRPCFLVSPPEPIEVLAELPEGPPAHFRWRRQSCRIRMSEGPERLTPEWWRSLSRPVDTAGASVGPN
ncbi:MAG: DNA polymerase Y family protein, partial [Pseudomonadota bacterium]